MKISKNPIMFFSFLCFQAVGIIAISAFFYFDSKGLELFGIIYGLFAGLIDLQISSYILFKVNDDKNTTKQYSVLVIGFFLRMLLMLGGGFALENVEKYLGISFALSYLAAHFAHIGGFAMYTMRRMKEEQEQLQKDKESSSNETDQDKEN